MGINRPCLPPETGVFRFEVPIRLVSEANHRDAHWAVKAKRVKDQRHAVLLM